MIYLVQKNITGPVEYTSKAYIDEITLKALGPKKMISWIRLIVNRGVNARDAIACKKQLMSSCLKLDLKRPITNLFIKYISYVGSNIENRCSLNTDCFLTMGKDSSK